MGKSERIAFNEEN